MQLIEERCTSIPGGCIVYDAACVRKAGDELFDRSAWAAEGRQQRVTGGRGAISIIEHPGVRWVLRHYRRGGFAARLSEDRYLWLGAARTRSFAEWRLLARMRALGLPVPRPIAARYRRHLLTYSADLITEMLEQTITLAQALDSSGVESRQWREIGRTIYGFHQHGIHHADLNAHNILLCALSTPAQAPSLEPPVYVLDFDRGRIRARGAWEEQVLARLRRSLEKVCARGGRAFSHEQWELLMEGYRDGERRTASGER